MNIGDQAQSEERNEGNSEGLRSNLSRRQQKKHMEMKKKGKNPKMRLKEIMSSIRIKLLVENFIKKISRNNVERNPVDYTPFEEKIDRSEEHHGI